MLKRTVGILTLFGLLLAAWIVSLRAGAFRGPVAPVERTPGVALEHDLNLAAAPGDRVGDTEDPRFPLRQEGEIQRPAPEGENTVNTMAPTTLGGSEPFAAVSEFGTVWDIMASRKYNPGGVVLDRERRTELSGLLASLEADHALILTELRRTCDDEIERRVSAGEFRKPADVGSARSSPGPGHIAHMRKDPVHGRIEVSFAPSDVPTVAAAYANRAAFLAEAEYQLRAFFH